MKGFTVRINDEVYNIALESGGVGVLITNKEGEYIVTLHGTDGKGVYHQWHKKKLQLGDILIIKPDSTLRSVEPLQYVRDYEDREAIDKLQIAEYMRLKAELMDEGYEI